MPEPDEGLRELDRKIAAARRAFDRMQEPLIDLDFIARLPADRPRAQFEFGDHRLPLGTPSCGDVAWSLEQVWVGSAANPALPVPVRHNCARIPHHTAAHATAASGHGWSRGYYWWRDLPSEGGSTSPAGE